MPRAKFLTACALIFLLGCSREKIEWTDFAEVDPEAWPLNQGVFLECEPHELNAPYALRMALRHTVDYPYSNLFLFRSITVGADTLYSDTLELELADSYGEWTGKGNGASRELIFPFRKNWLRFERSGVYRFNFVHGMRDSSLLGIEGIGLSLIRVEEEDSTHRPQPLR